MPLGDDFLLVKIGNSVETSPKLGEDALGLFGKAAAALKKPGIARNAVFRGSVPSKVYAYSAFPSDSSKLIRETSDGKRQIVKISADGKFRILKKLA